MKTSPHFGLGIVVLLLIVAGVFYFVLTPKATAPTTSVPTALSQKVVKYSCSTGSFVATYASSSVAVVLSDGRSTVLSQVPSGSGIRYESPASQTPVFALVSKGADAFLTENGTTTFDNCVENTDTATSTASGDGTKSFTDTGKTISFNYPATFPVTEGGIGYTQGWSQNATTSGLILAKITVPGTIQPKSNFSDATFTVGTSADTAAQKSCLTYEQSGGGPAAKSTVTINGVTYTKFVTTDAGAGNFYQTTSYKTLRNSQCYAIEYTIHSTNLANYTPDQGISAFDQAKVQGILEGIVQSVKFLPS